jgi:hypothetical protein
VVACRAVSIQRVPDDIVVIVTSVPLTRRMLSCSSSTVSGLDLPRRADELHCGHPAYPEPMHVHAVRRVVKSWPQLLLVHHVDHRHPTGDGRVGAGEVEAGEPADGAARAVAADEVPCAEFPHGLPEPVTSSGAAPVRDDHSQTGFGSRSPGRCSTCRRIRVPGSTGRSPSWSIQAARRVNLGWTCSQALAFTVPYRLVVVLVVTAGIGQVVGSARRNSTPCFDERPIVARDRGGDGRRRTRSVRSRPSTSTGRSASRNAGRVTS